MTMMRSPQLIKVCKLGQLHDCCRYLLLDMTGMHCAKFVPSIRALLDQRVAQQTMTARGDNCPGLPPEEVL